MRKDKTYDFSQMQGKNMRLLVVFLLILATGCIMQSEEKSAMVLTLNLTQSEERVLSNISTDQDLTMNGTQEVNETKEGTEVREFNITAKKYYFEPSELMVNKGDIVRLRITSADITHGFFLGAYDIIERLEPGKTIEIEFNASKAGTFPFISNAKYEEGNPKMSGLLTVE